MSTDAPLLACHCGSTVFNVRASAVESAGLATCDRGHHALLLDSRDVWAHIIQASRPRELRCRCKGKTFELTVDYSFRDGTRTVRAFDVRARCATCAEPRDVFHADVDYDPTDALLDRPLDPIDDPWQKARWVEVTGLWKRDDLARLLRFISTLPNACITMATWREAPRQVTADAAALATKSASSYDLLLGNETVFLPENLRDVWKSLPLVHVGTPTSMHYSTGVGELYYVRYALERIIDGKVLPQSAAFLTFATQIRAWLASELVAERGKNTADNPAEYQRLKDGW